MKRQITLALALTLGVLLALVSLPSVTRGQQKQRYRVDSGVLTPGAGQVLRATVDRSTDINDVYLFRWARYTEAGCSGGGVCRHTVASQGATQPESLGPNEALSFDVQGTGAGARVVVESNSRDARVVFQIIDTSTGDVIAIWVPQGSPFISNQ